MTRKRRRSWRASGRTPATGTDPDDLDIDRTRGFGVEYEQIGSGREPEREIFNQRYREWDGWAEDRIRTGVLPWDGDIDYPRHAFVTRGGALYVATVATGPAGG